MRGVANGIAMVFATCAAIFAAVPSTEAADTLYCDILVEPHSACSSYVVGVEYNNEAYYLGSGNVTVCEHAYYYSGGATVSRRCANNHVTSSSDLYYSCNYNLATKNTVGNDDDNRHTIRGYATHGNGSAC